NVRMNHLGMDGFSLPSPPLGITISPLHIQGLPSLSHATRPLISPWMVTRTPKLPDGPPTVHEYVHAPSRSRPPIPSLGTRLGPALQPSTAPTMPSPNSSCRRAAGRSGNKRDCALGHCLPSTRSR